MEHSLRRELSKGLPARVNCLTPQQQGPLILVLLGNSVFTIVLQASWLVVVW
ncbi:MAG: hypothetical protein ABI382_08925 [Nakamurella sp.]